MIQINESDIDRITEVFSLILKGKQPSPITLPVDHPINEVRQLVDYINRFIIEYNETTNFVYNLGRGEINIDPPKGILIICQSLKGLQASLRNLTWITKQVATGDFNHQVNFMGEFSAAFNSMTAQLRASFEQRSKSLQDLQDQITALDKARKETLSLMKDLDKAKKEAEEASHVKSDFLSTVSHELRTPLTSVLGFAMIIKNKFEEVVLPAVGLATGRMEKTMRQIRGNLEIIISEGERLTELINTVLDITKLESGRIDWNIQPISIGNVIERAASATSSLFERKDLRLIKEIEEHLPEVAADRDWLTQVVINLISNAWKFTDQGEITVRAKIAKDSAGERKMMEVSVADQGIGIPADQHERIFEKFSQVGDALTDKPKGTGLGLAICKNVIENHGGRIWVESIQGKGSSFIFTLPIT